MNSRPSRVVPDGGWPWTAVGVRRGEDEIAASVDDLSRELSGVVVHGLISGVHLTGSSPRADEGNRTPVFSLGS